MFTGAWSSVSGQKNNPKAYNGTSHNAFYQRFRAQLDITASEALNGVVLFEIGDTVWGKGANAARNAGGGLGADEVAIEVKNAYVDWIPPHTDLQIRMGIQTFNNPSFMTGGAGSHNIIFGDDVAGISLNYQFTPNVGATAWWFRPFSDNSDDGKRTAGSSRQFDEMDMVGLALPLTFDGVKVTPGACTPP